MKRNILVVALVIAVAGLAVVAVTQRQQIAGLKDHSSTIAVAEKPQANPAPAPVMESPETVTETKPLEPVVAPVSAPVVAASPSTGRTNNPFAGLANMMKNPQMKEMVRAQQKVMLDRQYGSLSKYLNLPAERLDALRELLSDRQMALVDAGMSMMSGSELERKQAIEETKAIKSDYDKKIQEQLGSQDYPVFQDYEKTVNERMSVQMLKDALPAADALSDQQEDNLIAAMYQERKDMPASSLMNNQNPDPSQMTEERIAELEKQMEQLRQKYAERAAGILTPAQLEQFTKWQKQWNAMQMAGLKMSAQMFGNKPSAPAPARSPTP
jgi:hypothetical protein